MKKLLLFFCCFCILCCSVFVGAAVILSSDEYTAEFVISSAGAWSCQTYGGTNSGLLSFSQLTAPSTITYKRSSLKYGTSASFAKGSFSAFTAGGVTDAMLTSENNVHLFVDGTRSFSFDASNIAITNPGVLLKTDSSNVYAYFNNFTSSGGTYTSSDGLAGFYSYSGGTWSSLTNYSLVEDSVYDLGSSDSVYVAFNVTETTDADGVTTLSFGNANITGTVGANSKFTLSSFKLKTTIENLNTIAAGTGGNEGGGAPE